MNNIPMIKVELETMKQTMHHAFCEQLLNLDEQFQKAIEEACDPKAIQFLLNEAARTYIKQAMNEEVRWFFLNGPGRDVVKERVIKQLGDVEYD